ncbi:hypothetical protein BKA64DRAFT_688656 [Cadophora sp. MPI-SDFR-AT-0126]|nr:hypothetical protein BKA64DRAFT_688656 [Leotiomycetes sp. MPI-SDFR-AT-0126]
MIDSVHCSYWLQVSLEGKMLPFLKTPPGSSYRQIAKENPDAESQSATSEERAALEGYSHVEKSGFRPHGVLQWFLLFISLFEAIALALVAIRCPERENADTNSPVPQIPWINRNFTHHSEMNNLTSIQAVEAAWHDYETTAFVHVDNPERYSLRPNKGVEVGKENIYMLSAYHQLHCLKQLHLVFVGIMRTPTEDGEFGRGPEMRHVEHCFDYLRQGVLCAGDATLEGPDEGGSSLTGYGVEHRCRSWDEPGGLDNWRILNKPK